MLGLSLGIPLALILVLAVVARCRRTGTKNGRFATWMCPTRLNRKAEW